MGRTPSHRPAVMLKTLPVRHTRPDRASTRWQTLTREKVQPRLGLAKPEEHSVGELARISGDPTRGVLASLVVSPAREPSRSETSGMVIFMARLERPSA